MIMNPYGPELEETFSPTLKTPLMNEVKVLWLAELINFEDIIFYWNELI
jgi:hypothetical protein